MTDHLDTIVWTITNNSTNETQTQSFTNNAGIYFETDNNVFLSGFQVGHSVTIRIDVGATDGSTDFAELTFEIA